MRGWQPKPSTGWPYRLCWEISPAFGFQTGVLYYHANWIGNLAIGITAVSYLSTFFPALNNPIPAGIACIAIVWLFTFINMLGGAWVSRLTTIGLFLVLIPVVLTQSPAGIGSISRPITRTGTRLRRPTLTPLLKVFCSACGRSLALSLPPSAPAW
ncbi:lysine/cadaverine antiporter [Salmonella enterica subsp. enterica]|uniref:Lysine/cadaverine antiporter n=1 Tax=Salmonella enterica I TaxID=59201 RepID=A0A447N658_SALET|nr:lysine/cadaverine antiporter [Salmonella enterica subsp. enterica]